jgi:hypothetical protein
MPATPWPSSNRQVAHPFVTDTDEHHQNSVPPSFVRIHYSPYNSGAPSSSPSFGDRVGPDGGSRSDPARMNRNPGPILFPKKG